MSKAVVILGAGASADFGLPTLRGIFKDPVARKYLAEDSFLNEKLREVFWEPRGVSLENSDQSLTIEEMLTILRDWEREPNCKETPDTVFLNKFRKRLYILIMRAVYIKKSSKGMYLNPLLRQCNKLFDKVTWASFNWDCIFESSFFFMQNGPPQSRIDPEVVVDIKGWSGGSKRHELLKLHGGINWWKVSNELTYIPFGRGGKLISKWREYAKTPNSFDEPVILEPSAYKYDGDLYELLMPQWNRFFESLCEADCVIIVGYSLPEMDTQARSKILTAFSLNRNCRWLLVDRSKEVCERYVRLLGNKNFQAIPKKLCDFNKDVEKYLNDDLFLVKNVELESEILTL